MANTEFARMIKRLRTSRKLTMQQLADQLGVTKGAVSMWENKGVVPRRDILVKISQIFGISLDSLIGNEIVDEASSVSGKLSYIQRGLGKMDSQQLDKAEKVLKLVFDDLFDDDEGDLDDDI